MPSVLIEVRKFYTSVQEIVLMQAVHGALQEAFQLLSSDRKVRLLAHEPHRFFCSPGLSHPELFTHISIDAFAGRSLEAKRHLYQAIVTNLETLGIPRDHILIVLREIPTENWGIRGGQAACDVDLGFKIEV